MTKRVVRDSSTGRFRSVEVEEEQVSEKEPTKSVHKESDSERIRGTANKLNIAVHELEEALHEVGLIDEPQYSQYYYQDNEKEADDKGDQPREPSDFDQLFTNLRERRHNAERNERPYDVTRLNAMAAISALAFVVHKALYRIDPQFNLDPYLQEASTSTEGYVGYSDNESHFNRFAGLAFEQQNRLSYLLLGNSTYNKEAQDNPEVCDYLSVVSENYREHLHGAANVMDTLLGHTEWLIENIRNELL